MRDRLKIRYFIYQMYHYFLADEPVPVDIFEGLVQEGINPERILERFYEGETPPLPTEQPEDLWG